MIPGKINTHLLQDLTVIAKATQKGSIVYISPDNKIHSGTFFQKLSTFISRNWKDKSSASNDLKNNHTKAKELVINNLKKQIEIYFYIKNKDISNDLQAYIQKFSECLVDRITDPDSSISNEKKVLEDFKKVLDNLNSTTIDFTEIQSLKSSLNNAYTLSESSLEDKSKFKFSVLQFNEILKKDQSNARPTNFNKIDLISQNALWIKKNKWIDSKRALSLAKEMARDELSDLANNEKFNVVQKTLKSFEGKSREFYNENSSKELEKSAQIIKDKKIEKDLRIDKKLADFKKTLTYEQKKSINDEIMKEVLIANHNRGLNKDEIFAEYAWTLLEKKHNPIAK
jgi:hypothetical protein